MMRWVCAILIPVTVAAWTGPRASEHAVKGMDLAQAGNLKGAEAELREAVSLAPASSTYLANLGSVLGLESKFDESISCFEKALKIDPANAQVRRDLAAGQWQTGHLLAAAANLELVLKAMPADRPATLLLGMVRENLHDYAKAALLLASVPDLVNQRAESMAALARSLYRTGQHAKARELLNVNLLHSGNPRDLYLGGGIAAEAADSKTANNLFTEAQRILTDETSRHPSSDALNLLAWCYYKQGQLQQATRAMDQAIALEPANVSNYANLVLMLSDHQMLPVAAAVADQAVRNAPNSYRSHMLQGFVANKQGNYAAAVDSYQRAVALAPDSAEASLNLAKAQWHAGLNAESETTFAGALKLFPQDAPTKLEYALILLNRAGKGDPATEARAVDLLKQAASLDNSLAQPHLELGSLRLQQGNFAEASRELEIAVKLDAKDPKAHYVLSRVCRRLGQSAKAAEEFSLYEQLKSQEGKAN